MKASKKELFYNNFSDKWDSYINKAETKKRLDIVYNNLFKGIDLKGKKFLEIGCGLGYFSLEAKNRGVIVTAVDVGENLVRITKQKVKKGKFIVASASNLPFKNETFDIVLCTEVIEHVENQTKAFNEMFRVLKNNGYLVLTTPNKFFKPFFDLMSFANIRPYHGNEKWFFAKEIKAIFRNKKVDIVKEAYFNFIYPCDLLNKFERINLLKNLMINQGYLVRKNHA